MVGSEGTLGVITELTLQAVRHSGGDRLRRLPVPSRRCRLQGRHHHHPVRHPDRAHRIARRAAGQGGQRLFQARLCREAPMLFLEFHGTRGERRRAVASASARSPPNSAAGRSNGRPGRRTAPGSGRRATTATGRRRACGRARRLFATDVCVPISRLAECVAETQRDIAERDLIAPIVGHVGDGNFHLTLLVDMDDADEVRRAKRPHRAAGRAGAGRWTAPAPASTASARAR